MKHILVSKIILHQQNPLYRPWRNGMLSHKQ